MVRTQLRTKPLAPRSFACGGSLSCANTAPRLSASWLCQDEDSLFIAHANREVKRESFTLRLPLAGLPVTPPCGVTFYDGFLPVVLPFWTPKKEAKKCPLLPIAREARPRGYSPLGTPKRWSNDSKAKKCRSAAFFLTLLNRSPSGPSGTKNYRELSCKGAQCAPAQFCDNARLPGRTMFAPTG